MPKVYAPNREYKGISAGVQFQAGVGDTDDPATLAYLARSGYGIGAYPKPAEPAVVDARDVSQPIPLGTRLRDAAVDPRPTDFLAPINAGLEDPHGPLVVSPQIHASETGPIAAGDVHVDDPAIQDAKESAIDTSTFIEGETTAVTSVGESTEVASVRERPAKAASKADWVEFAVGQGLARDEAEDLSKAELTARFGG